MERLGKEALDYFTVDWRKKEELVEILGEDIIKEVKLSYEFKL